MYVLLIRAQSPNIPQLYGCGPIEARRRPTIAAPGRAIPQPYGCGPIGARTTGREGSTPGSIPRPYGGGPIEASIGRPRRTESVRHSAALSLRPRSSGGIRGARRIPRPSGAARLKLGGVVDRGGVNPRSRSPRLPGFRSGHRPCGLPMSCQAGVITEVLGAGGPSRAASADTLNRPLPHPFADYRTGSAARVSTTSA